ncbi:hypothetical protein H8U31_001337 [Salmonella enterica]|nr:hypothetical protein [Salmonella enterica]
MADATTTPDPRAGSGRESIVPPQKDKDGISYATGKPYVTGFDIVANEQPAPTAQPDWNWNPLK